MCKHDTFALIGKDRQHGKCICVQKVCNYESSLTDVCHTGDTAFFHYVILTRTASRRGSNFTLTSQETNLHINVRRVAKSVCMFQLLQQTKVETKVSGLKYDIV